MAISLIKRLIDTRANEWDEMQKILNRAEEENRDLTAEEQEQSEKATRSIGALDERIQQLEDLDKRNKSFGKQRAKYEGVTPVDGGPPSDEPIVADQFRALAKGEINQIEFDMTSIRTEVDSNGKVHYRDLSKLTAAAGGDVVPTDFVRRLYEHLVESSAIRRTNVTIVATSGGENLDFPKTTGLHTAALTAEAAAIAESDPTFAKVTLGAFKYAVATQVSFELLADTGVDLEGFLARDMGRSVGDNQGIDFIVGDGSAKPNGVVTASTLGVTGGAGVSGVFTVDNLIDLYYSVIDPYAARGTWMMRRASEGSARKLKDSNNNYLWQPSLVSGTPNTLLGRPVVTDPNIVAEALSAKSVIFGDMSAYVIRDAGGLRVARSDDFAFTSDLATFKAVLRSDGDLVDATGAVKHYIGNAA